MLRWIEHLLGMYRSIGLAYLLFVYLANSFGPMVLPPALREVKLQLFPKVQFILWQEICDICVLSAQITYEKHMCVVYIITQHIS